MEHREGESGLGLGRGRQLTGPPAASPTHRTLVVVENAGRHLIVPAANFVMSYLVVSEGSPEVWGRFAQHLVVVSLAAHLLAWGNKEYLLRTMSADASTVPELWQSSLLTRCAGLPLVLLLLAALGVHGRLMVWMAIWLLLAYLYQSFDVVVLFGHRFRLAIAAEVAGLATSVALLLGRPGGFDEDAVIAAFVSGLLVKTAIVAIGLAPTLLRRRLGRPGLRHVRGALPFTLLSLSGLLQSRVDLYAMAILASPADMGRYQVTVSFYIVLQALAAFVLMPFVRELYAGGDDLSHVVANRLAAGGVAVAALATPVAWVVLNGLYGFELGWPVFVIGAIMVLPVYRYMPRIYLSYKHGAERAVVAINLAGAAVNLALAVALIPSWSIAGALGAAAASQWFTLICHEIVAGRRHPAAAMS